MSLTRAPNQTPGQDPKKERDHDIVLTPEGAEAVPKGAGKKFLVDKMNSYELKHEHGILKTNSGEYLDFKTAQVLTAEEVWERTSKKSQEDYAKKQESSKENINNEQFYDRPEIKNILSLVEAKNNNRASHDVGMLNKYNDALNVLFKLEDLQKDENTTKSFDSLKEIVRSDWKQISENIIDDKIKTRMVSYLKDNGGNVNSDEMKRLFGKELAELEALGVSKMAISQALPRYDREVFNK